MRIELTGIKKTFKDRLVLDINALELESGKIFALLGPNGSGKSTMLRILSGIHKPDQGQVLYDGNDVIPLSSISFLNQNPYIFNLTVLENVMLGAGKKNNAGGMAREALSYMGMMEFSSHKAVFLSGGEAQKVVVARTLVSGKSLVLLDEPASAIDIQSMGLVEEYIKLVNRKYGSTIIFATHNPSQALRTAHEALILWNGSVIERGKASEILTKPRRKETRDFLNYWGHAGFGNGTGKKTEQQGTD